MKDTGHQTRTSGFSRRALLGSALAVAGAGVGFAGGSIAATAGFPPDPRQGDAGQADSVSPLGRHQAGIETPQQRYATFVAADLQVVDAAALRDLLKDLSATIVRITRGLEPPDSSAFPPGADATTDFASGLPPARLTVTVGLGPRAFELAGLARAVPLRLRPLPGFAVDRLDPRWGGGDLLLQLCADDAQVVSAAMRALRARLPGFASIRWTQSGFVGLQADGSTPRNMFGQRDGTANPRAGSAEFAETVWALPDEPAWFTGGTYLVFRKIRMDTAHWDLTPRTRQDAALGRRRSDGAPLTGADEFDEPDLGAAKADGSPVIATDAHIRRVGGFPMFRRSYSYDYGFLTAMAGGSPDPLAAPDDHVHEPGTEPHHHGGHGSLDAGLLFCAYGNDPDAQFIPAQRRMAEADGLNRFLQHTGSAIFAILPGFGADGYLGDTLV